MASERESRAEEAVEDGAQSGGRAPETVASLVAEIAPPEESRAVVRTGTRADVGDWWGGRRVWLFCFGTGVALAAPGPSPYREWADHGALTETIYNHVTGELVLAPAESLSIKRLGMGPLDADRVQRLLGASRRGPEKEGETDA